MFDVFWAISSDNGLKKKNSGLVELRESWSKKWPKSTFILSVSGGRMLFKFCMLTW